MAETNWKKPVIKSQWERYRNNNSHPGNKEANQQEGPKHLKEKDFATANQSSYMKPQNNNKDSLEYQGAKKIETEPSKGKKSSNFWVPLEGDNEESIKKPP